MLGLMAIQSRDVSVPLPGSGTMGAYLALPAAGEPRAALLVAHELFGVSPDIRGVVDQLAELGYAALAPEFYHRSAPHGQWLPRDDAGRTRGFEQLRSLTRDGVVEDVRAAMAYARGVCPNPRVGMLGFSMGGHIAYLAATQLDLTATAVLYGGWLASTDIPLSQPNPTLDLTRGIAEHGGHVLYLVGGKDHLITAEQVALIRSALQAAEVLAEVVVYPDAAHAFFWPNTPAFHAEARAAAWDQLTEFFQKTLT